MPSSSSWSRARGLVRHLLAAVCVLPAAALATVTINERFDPATIAQGDTSKYVIEIYNDVGTQLTGAAATVLLGPDIAVTSASILSNTCGGGVVAATGLGSAVQLTGGTVPAAGGGVPGTCRIEVAVTSVVSGNHSVDIPANTAPTPTQAGFQAQQGGTTVSNDTAATVTLLVTALSPPTGSKTFAPATAYAGVPTRLQITLANPNTGKTMPLTTFTDGLPAGMQVAAPPNAGVACTGTGFVNGTVTANAGDSAVTLAGGTIGEGGDCVLSVDVVVPTITGTSQTLTNTLPAGAIGNTRGLSSPAFSRALPVSAPVSVAKAFSPAVIPAGQASALTITVTNNGAVPLTGVAFTDALPAGTLVASPAAAATTCTGGSVTASAGSNSVALAGGSVPAGGSCTVTVNVTANAEGAYTNTIPANGVSNNEGIGTPAASANLTAYAQLRITKSASPARVAPGQWTEFSVTVQNYSGGPVTNASLLDNLPLVAGHQMVLDYSAAPQGCGFNFTPSGTENFAGAAILRGTGGSIPAGSGTTPGSCTVTFRALAPAGTPAVTFNNEIPVGGIEGNGVQNTNNSFVNVAVVDAVVLAKAFSPTSVFQGQASVLTLTVANRNVSALTGINLTDNLPAGLVLAANPAATSTCGGTLQAFPGASSVTLTGGSIVARPDAQEQASCEIKVRVTGNTVEDYTNTIPPAQFSSSGGTVAAPVSANLAISAGLSATKVFSPAAVATGGRSRVTIRATNQTPGTLTNVSIKDSGLAAGLTVANPANAASSCAGAPVVTANPGDSAVRLDGATLGASASCELSFDVQASGTGPWANTIAQGDITSAEGAWNSTAVTATLGTQSAQLALNKSFNPVLVTGNAPSVLTIDVVNSSSARIDGASFSDVFPSGIIVYSVPDASTTCSGATVTAVPGAGQVALTGANLAANATCQVRVTVTSVAFLNLTNTIPAGAVKSLGGYTNAQATAATLSTLQGLGVSKGFEPAYVAPGQTSRLKIRLVNSYDPNVPTPKILTGVSYTDTLPAGLVFAVPPNASTSCTGAQVYVDNGAQAVTLTGMTLVPGGICDLFVDVKAAVVGPYLNEIPVGAVRTDQGISNPAPPAQATLNVVLAPTVSKSFSVPTVTVGQASQLIVVVSNPAAIALTGVSLADNLPHGVTVANPADTSTTCAGASVAAQPGAARVALSGATVPAGASCEFRVAVKASEPGTFTNTIGAGAVGSDQGLSNGNPTSANLTALAPPSLSKAFAPVQLPIGGTSTLTITLNNTNSTAITLTSELVDALPGKVFIASPANVGGTCPGTKTATPGGIDLRYASGAQIPAGGCTITVDVTSSDLGAYTNTIAAGQLQTNAGSNPEPAVATLGVGQPAAPVVVKAFSPASIPVNGVSRLTITLGNANNTVLTLASALTDSLPTNVVVAAVPNIAGSCTRASVGAVAGASAVSYATGATIPAGGCTIEVDVTAAVAGSYTNQIPAGGLATVEAGANPTPALAPLVVAAPAEPTVQKAFSPSTINPGGTSRLRITLGNSNASAATLTADLVDNLPTHVLVAQPPAIGGTCQAVSVTAVPGGNTVRYASGAGIPVGGCSIEVNVTSSVSGGPYVNTIAAGSLQTNQGSNGAPASAELLVNPGQPPSVSKSFAPATIASGGRSTLTISLGNGNAGAATLTAALTDALPAGLTVATPPALAGTCPSPAQAVAGGTTLSYPAGALIPAGGCSIQVNVTSSTPGTVTNTIAAGALQSDLGSNAVATSAPLTVLGAGSLASIAGTVYHDRNDDGSIGAGEPGIAGVQVILTTSGPDGTQTWTTTTDANGHYSFTGLVPGTYTVTEVQPTGWVDGKVTAGSHGGTAGSNQIAGVTLQGGDNATGYNFGERTPSVVAPIPVDSPFALAALALALLGWVARRQRMARR